MNTFVPLGIKLSERISLNDQRAGQKIFERIFYDYSDSINKIQLGKDIIPAILYKNYLGTETFTIASGEITDKDFSHDIGMLGTETQTKADGEETDQDYNSNT